MSIVDARELSKNKSASTGLQKSRFNPAEGSERRFKGGLRLGNENICKKRY
jgi:hypothetical protein